MVSYKKKYLEVKKELNKLKNYRIDLSDGAVENRIKNNIPLLLYKWRWRIEEQDDKYLLFDIPKKA